MTDLPPPHFPIIFSQLSTPNFSPEKWKFCYNTCPTAAYKGVHFFIYFVDASLSFYAHTYLIANEVLLQCLSSGVLLFGPSGTRQRHSFNWSS